MEKNVNENLNDGVEDLNMELDAITEGAFIESLKRNNKRIREDRAAAISEDVHLLYNRVIEDLILELRNLIRDRDNMLDLSPTDATSLVLASDFDSKAFVEKDLEIGVKIRNLQIKIDIAKKRFAHLFGK